jgi:hypothetical protein
MRPKKGPNRLRSSDPDAPNRDTPIGGRFPEYPLRGCTQWVSGPHLTPRENAAVTIAPCVADIGPYAWTRTKARWIAFAPSSTRSTAALQSWPTWLASPSRPSGVAWPRVCAPERSSGSGTANGRTGVVRSLANRAHPPAAPCARPRVGTTARHGLRLKTATTGLPAVRACALPSSHNREVGGSNPPGAICRSTCRAVHAVGRAPNAAYPPARGLSRRTRFGLRAAPPGSFRRHRDRCASPDAATACPRGCRRRRCAAIAVCASSAASWSVRRVAIPTGALIPTPEGRSLGSLSMDRIATLRPFARSTLLAPALRRLRYEVHRATSLVESTFQ